MVRISSVEAEKYSLIDGYGVLSTMLTARDALKKDLQAVAESQRDLLIVIPVPFP